MRVSSPRLTYVREPEHYLGTVSIARKPGDYPCTRGDNHFQSLSVPRQKPYGPCEV